MSGWLNVDRAVQQGEEEWGGGGGDADAGGSDDFETTTISSRYDECHSTASLCVLVIVEPSFNT